MADKLSSFASRSILYYPTLEFQSETWVKASLLFWDKIYRIVPTSYNTRDSDEIKIAISNGFIEDIELTDKDLRHTADKFESFVISYNSIHLGSIAVLMKSDFTPIKLTNGSKDFSSSFRKTQIVKDF